MAVTSRLVNRVTVSVKPEDYKSLHKIAERNGISVATTMQIAIKQFLNRQKEQEITLER